MKLPTSKATRGGKSRVIPAVFCYTYITLKKQGTTMSSSMPKSNPYATGKNLAEYIQSLTEIEVFKIFTGELKLLENPLTNVRALKDADALTGNESNMVVNVAKHLGPYMMKASPTIAAAVSDAVYGAMSMGPGPLEAALNEVRGNFNLPDIRDVSASMLKGPFDGIVRAQNSEQTFVLGRELGPDGKKVLFAFDNAELRPKLPKMNDSVKVVREAEKPGFKVAVSPVLGSGG